MIQQEVKMVEQDFQASMKEAEEEITAAGKQPEDDPASLTSRVAITGNDQCGGLTKRIRANIDPLLFPLPHRTPTLTVIRHIPLSMAQLRVKDL